MSHGVTASTVGAGQSARDTVDWQCDMEACGNANKCKVVSILRFTFYTCVLACALLAALTIFQDSLAPTSNMEGTLALLHEPSYIIANSGLCPDDRKSVKVLIMVTSAPEHFEKRQSIRFTWGHFMLRHDTVITFFLGAVTNSSLQEKVEKESLVYTDIIQTKNVDSYKNLTLKTLSMLQWVNQYCSGIGFVLKTDDDMFINVPRLLLFVDNHSAMKNTIYGNVARNWRPIRSNNSKYYVSEEMFRDPLYPSFSTGPAYLLTGDVPARLTSAALMKASFPLEDVFFTGIIAEDLRIKRVNDRQFHPYLKKNVHCDFLKLISIHNVSVKEQYSLWAKVANNFS